MSTHAERLQSLINKLNLNPRSFAIQCGYSQATTIYSIIKRDAKPTSSTLDKICNRFPQVNREWLMTGYGSMFTTQENDDLTVTAKQVIDKLENEVKDLKNELKFIRASLLGIEMFHGIDIKTKSIKNKNV
tara:strand:- start:136 stop:528 length:393 start_codon:yes stop_codon:yes gene_type:complete